MLEPYSCQRDVAYIVVAPENDLVLNSVKLFFKEFSAVYEVCWYFLCKTDPVVWVLVKLIRLSNQEAFSLLKKKKN